MRMGGASYGFAYSKYRHRSLDSIACPVERDDIRPDVAIDAANRGRA